MGELTVLEVSVAAFRPEDEKTADSDIEYDSCCAEPPDHRITQKVDLTVISDPEILQHEIVSV